MVVIAIIVNFVMSCTYADLRHTLPLFAPVPLVEWIRLFLLFVKVLSCCAAHYLVTL
jgi:hypothetical protein